MQLAEREAPIVRVLGVGAAISILQEIVRTERVVIRSIRNSGDGQRRFRQDPGLEDALRRDERHAPAVQHEPTRKQRSRQHVAHAVDLGSQPLEGRIAHRRVARAIEHIRYVVFR